WWRGVVEGDGGRLWVDGSGGENTERSMRHVAVSLTQEETLSLLQEVGGAYRMQIQELLLAALGLTLGEVTVSLEGHGREEEWLGRVDLTRTVGWFTTVYPVRLAVQGMDEEAALRRVKEQLRSVPSHGIGYGVLRYLLGEDLGGEEPGEVSFNYLGQFDQVLGDEALFRAAEEPSGPARSPRAEQRSLLGLTAAVANGQLRLDWAYSENLHRRETIEEWAQRYLAELRSLMSHCRGVLAGRQGKYTPSDFSLAGLGMADLDRILGAEWGIEDVYPLSPLQEGLLFHSLYAPGSVVYLSQLLCRLEGGVDEPAFEEACRRVVMNHSTLRTSFRWEGLERPLQVVHGQVEVVLRHEDWRGLPALGRESRRAELLRTDRRAGFDLARAPLMRWTLIRTGEHDYEFLWSHHHILLDGWSFSAIAGEFLAGYEALRSGREPEPARHLPYRQYIAWLERKDSAASEQYWRQALAGFTEPTSLAALGRHGSGPRGSFAYEARLSPSMTAALSAQARRHRLTLNTLTQGAWGVLLGRYSAQQDVVFGATVSGRPPDLPGVDAMVGLFINTLPVRLAVPGQTPVLSWLEDLQRRQAELRQYEHSPLVQVQSWSEVPRGRELFDSILVFENYPREAAMRREGLSLRVAEVRSFEQTSYPLTVTAAPGEEMVLSIDSDRVYFDEVVVLRLVAHLRNLVESLASPPDEAGWRLSDLPLLSAAERHQLLWGWNDTAAGVREQCVHELFERQAEATPDALAVVAGGERCSYRELNVRANRLAHRLRRLGVGPEVLVGLCLERSLDLIVAVLAVLKAGGAYLPLDPVHPAERLALMLSEAGASRVVTRS
ncbi:MAG TPA: condensation domain-containing protein, partial [Thermoanaerobaculia bacterium]|nr:condensation domain-containing protein [Thermoanaerobaculia bacterium]